MKILIASDTFIFQTSGAANVVISLSEGLRRRGHDVRVLAPSDRNVSFRDGDNFFIRSHQSFLYPDVRMCFVNKDPLLDEIVSWKPDLIHLHTEATIARLAYRISEATGAPVVATLHTDYAYFAFKRYHDILPVHVLMSLFGKRNYRDARAVIVPSEKARYFAPIQACGKPVVVIPNGIRLDHFQKPVSAKERAELFSKYNLEDNGCTLVMITRVSKEKNMMEILHYLPALLEKLPQAQLLIAGDGPDRERLEKYCEEHDLTEHVCFTGRIPPDEVYRYYAMGDIFVSASTFEVHSLSCLEAMACGLPMVCREDKSLLGVLDEGENGFLYHTEQEFVEDIEKIIKDQELKESMHKNALERAEHFSDERFVDNSLKLYHKVVG